MSIHIESGQPLPLEISLADGNATRYPRARVYLNGTEVAGSPFNLTNTAGGYYRNTSFTPSSDGYYTAKYEVFADASYTIPRTQYGYPIDNFEVDSRVSEVTSILADTSALETRLTPARATNLDNLDAAITSRQSEANALTRYNNLINEHNSTQVQLNNRADTIDTTLGTPTDTNIATDIANVQTRANLLETDTDASNRYNNLINQHTTTQLTLATLETKAQADSRQAILVGEHNQTQTDISNLSTKIGTPVSATVSNDIANIKTVVDTLETDSDADLRYNNLLTEHNQTQIDIANLSASITAPLPATIAQAVWSEAINTYAIPNSAGAIVNAINQTTISTLDEITNGPNNLSNILSGVTDNNNDISTLSTQVTNENNVIRGELVTAESNLTSEIGQNRVDIAAVSTNVDNTRNTLITEINQNETKIDSIQSSVSGIQNNTDVVAVVPERMVVPDALSSPKTYQFVLETFNDSGVPINADSTPTVKIYDSSGAVYLAETSMAQDGVKTGVYIYSLSITDAQVPLILRVEFKTIINAVTKYSQRTSEFVEFDSTLESIENKVDSITLTTTDNNTLLTGANGLAQLKSEILTNRTEIDANEIKIDDIKTVTDALPNNIATQTDTDNIVLEISNVPTNAELTSALNNQTDSIKGPDTRNLTEVYDNQRGTDNALLASDPRLNFLDAAVSSRSTLTDVEVWTYATRELTASTPLSPVDAQAIWSTLLTSISTAGSIGKLIKDYLDVAVSTRSTLSLAQLQAELVSVATESNVDDVRATVQTENNENQILLNTAISLLNSIKPKTDKIVDGGATELNVNIKSDEIKSLINGVDAVVDIIRARTDLIPNDPARQSSVLDIPTDSLLETDPRLNLLNNLVRLDVAVSSRAESFPGDYATKTDLDNTEAAIISEVNANETKIDALPQTTYFDTKFAEIEADIDLTPVLDDLALVKGSGFDTAQHSLVEIRDNQDNIGGGPGGGATAAQIWSYSNRSLTQDVVENSDLDAAKAEIISGSESFNARMNTTVDIANDKQVVIAWLDRQGQTITGTTNCRIEVKYFDGTLIWAKDDTTPDARGVFVLEQEEVTALYEGYTNNFYMTITIEFDGNDYRTIQPFYTIG